MHSRGMQDSGHLVSTGIGFQDFATGLHRSLVETLCTKGKKKIKVAEGLEYAREAFRAAHQAGGKVIFIGNGGSAAICSHLAIDYTKNGGIRSIAFNDAPTLTCLSNDYGYFSAFARQIEYYSQPHDVVVCISSSGKSKNILEAAAEAMTRELKLITFTGMAPNNPLQAMGEISFYVPAGDYGLVEITHLALLHSITSVHNLT